MDCKKERRIAWERGVGERRRRAPRSSWPAHGGIVSGRIAYAGLSALLSLTVVSFAEGSPSPSVESGGAASIRWMFPAANPPMEGGFDFPPDGSSSSVSSASADAPGPSVLRDASVSELQRILLDPGEPSGKNAALHLARMGDGGASVLHGAAGSSSAEVRKRAIAALDAAGPEARRKAMRFFESNQGERPHPGTKALGLLELAGGNDPSGAALDRLFVALNDPDPVVRWCALKSLASLRPASDRMMPALEASLRDPDRDVREMSAMTAGFYGGESEPLAPLLIEALARPEFGNRLPAVEALAAMGGAAKNAVSELRRLLEEPDPMLRERAAFALGRVGKFENAVARSLIVCLNDENPRVRAAAAWALERLQPMTPAQSPGFERPPS